MTEQERRRYFRIDDQVGLALTPIAAADEDAALAGFADSSARVGLINEMRALREQHLPQRRALESRFPTVAAYIGSLERQIEILALAIGQRDDFPSHPDTPANISGQGIGLLADLGVEIGALIDIKLALFPDRCRIEALARVIKIDRTADGVETVMEFTHLREADREAIIHHVHALQRTRLYTQTFGEPPVGSG